MDKIRVGVVGLGHRGRAMLKLSAEGFDYVEIAAACDILPKNWFDKEWVPDASGEIWTAGPSLSEQFPNAQFY